MRDLMAESLAFINAEPPIETLPSKKTLAKIREIEAMQDMDADGVLAAEYTLAALRRKLVDQIAREPAPRTLSDLFKP